MTRDNRRGFSIMEMLITVLLTTLVFAGVASVVASSFSAQTKAFHEQSVESSATLLTMRLTRDASAADYILEPSAGSSGDVLSGYIGITCTASCGGAAAFASTQTGDTTGSYSYFQYCRLIDPATQQQQLWYYRQDNIPVGQAPAVPPQCDGTSGSGSWELLAGSSLQTFGHFGAACGNQFGANCLFSRVMASAPQNLVGIDFDVIRPPQANDATGQSLGLNMTLKTNQPEATPL